MKLADYEKHIIHHPLFIKLKTIVEHFEGWHDTEDVYEHSLKTASDAKTALQGKFISNTEAKAHFIAWINKEFFGMSRGDILVIAALLHDCGKILQYKENTTVKPLITSWPLGKNQTYCPGHELWGSQIVVPEILKELPMDPELKKHIGDLVRMHDTFNNPSYYKVIRGWSVEQIVMNVKARGEGYYKEILFNAYCDCYNAKGFIKEKRLIGQLFNEPTLYIPRVYFLP